MTLFTLAKAVTPQQEARAFVVLVLSVLLPALLSVYLFRLARSYSQQGKNPLLYEVGGTLWVATSLFILWLGPGQSWLAILLGFRFPSILAAGLTLAAFSLVGLISFRFLSAKSQA